MHLSVSIKNGIHAYIFEIDTDCCIIFDSIVLFRLQDPSSRHYLNLSAKDQRSWSAVSCVAQASSCLRLLITFYKWGFYLLCPVSTRLFSPGGGWHFAALNYNFGYLVGVYTLALVRWRTSEAYLKRVNLCLCQKLRGIKRSNYWFYSPLVEWLIHLWLQYVLCTIDLLQSSI